MDELLVITLVLTLPGSCLGSLDSEHAVSKQGMYDLPWMARENSVPFDRQLLPPGKPAAPVKPSDPLISQNTASEKGTGKGIRRLENHWYAKDGTHQQFSSLNKVMPNDGFSGYKREITDGKFNLMSASQVPWQLPWQGNMEIMQGNHPSDLNIPTHSLSWKNPVEVPYSNMGQQFMAQRKLNKRLAESNYRPLPDLVSLKSTGEFSKKLWQIPSERISIDKPLIQQSVSSSAPVEISHMVPEHISPLLSIPVNWQNLISSSNAIAPTQGGLQRRGVWDPITSRSKRQLRKDSSTGSLSANAMEEASMVPDYIAPLLQSPVNWKSLLAPFNSGISPGIGSLHRRSPWPSNLQVSRNKRLVNFGNYEGSSLVPEQIAAIIESPENWKNMLSPRFSGLSLQQGILHRRAEEDIARERHRRHLLNTFPKKLQDLLQRYHEIQQNGQQQDREGSEKSSFGAVGYENFPHHNLQNFLSLNNAEQNEILRQSIARKPLVVYAREEDARLAQRKSDCSVQSYKYLYKVGNCQGWIIGTSCMGSCFSQDPFVGFKACNCCQASINQNNAIRTTSLACRNGTRIQRQYYEIRSCSCRPCWQNPVEEEVLPRDPQWTEELQKLGIVQAIDLHRRLSQLQNKKKHKKELMTAKKELQQEGLILPSELASLR